MRVLCILALLGSVYTKTYDVNPCSNMYKPHCNLKRRNESHSELRQHFRQALKNKTVALVGDSLTRQWMETLACFLGETINWDVDNNHQVDLEIVPLLHDPPRGAPQGTGAWAFTSGPDFTIEYYHLDRYNTKIVPYLRRQLT